MYEYAKKRPLPLCLYPVPCTDGITKSEHELTQIFLSGLLYRTRDMAVVGLVLSLLCLVVTLVSLHTYGTLLYGLNQVSRVANSYQDFSARSSKNPKGDLQYKKPIKSEPPSKYCTLYDGLHICSAAFAFQRQLFNLRPKFWPVGNIV
jgi:hypothetical protein